MAKSPARLPRSRLEKPRSRERSQPALSYKHIENFTKDLEVRRDLGNRASPATGFIWRGPKHKTGVALNTYLPCQFFFFFFFFSEDLWLLRRKQRQRFPSQWHEDGGLQLWLALLQISYLASVEILPSMPNAKPATARSLKHSWKIHRALCFLCVFFPQGLHFFCLRFTDILLSFFFSLKRGINLWWCWIFFMNQTW